jgi:F5/8 type C domain
MKSLGIWASVPLLVSGMFWATAAAAATSGSPVSNRAAADAIGVIPPIVFVSRAIPASGGSVYLPSAKDMPGVGPHSRFDPSSPGKLIIRETDGTQRVLIDGSKPKTATLQLADVTAPDVSYDGTRIVFSGLAKGAIDNHFGAEGYAGQWRIYVINVDGTGLTRLTFDEANRAQLLAGRNLSADFLPFDDGDPVWLPNGDIAFSSTRYPAFTHYGNVRTSNLHTMRPDGTDLRRITSERNGADRPIVDPDTGKIVFARWWRNYRFPTNSSATIPDNINGGYIQKDGLTSVATGGDPDVSDMDRNSWHAATINPNGSQLTKWSGVQRDDVANFFYGGSFDANGQLISNFFPTLNMTDAGGFGGVRRIKRGASVTTSLIGVNRVTTDANLLVAPGSLGVYKLGAGGVASHYAADPAVLPDGRIVVSLSTDTNQDYGLYVMNANGSSPELLLDLAGTSELRAKVVQSRPLPLAVRPRHTGTILALMPPLPGGPYDESGTYIFDSRNVFFNAPVDTDIVNAPPVGSVTSIRFFIDHQRQSPGSYPNLDWPEVVLESPISPAGAIRAQGAAAGVSLFEQLRSPTGTVPLTGGGGTAHVAGMNYGVRDIVNKCVGCHAGHTMIEVPKTQSEFEYTNLAPGATVTVSSTRDAATNGGLIDRRVQKGDLSAYWSSAAGQTNGQWAKLHFQVPVTVRGVRLYNPRQASGGRSTLQVNSATVELCADINCNNVVATNNAGALSEAGTDVTFNKVRARAVRVTVNSVSGTYLGLNVAGLAEIEVIARGEAP